MKYRNTYGAGIFPGIGRKVLPGEVFEMDHLPKGMVDKTEIVVEEKPRRKRAPRKKVAKKAMTLDDMT